MTDFLLELRSEEIPARMQAAARRELDKLFRQQIGEAGLNADSIAVYSTPRRLALIAKRLADETQAVSEERKGPRADAPDKAIEGFLRSVSLTRDQLVEREDKKGGQVLFAVIDTPGRATRDVLAEAIPAIIRAFSWPKSMRWGAASESTESLKWVRPLQGIVAIFGEELVECEVGDVASGFDTVGHRFHHDGPITIGGADDYIAKLRACHVIVDQAEREAIVRDGAAKAAAKARLELVADEGLVVENAGLTEWPVPLLGRFDAAYLDVPQEVIQLTARVNQKYFVTKNPPRAQRGEGDHAQHGGGVNSSHQAEDPSTTSWSPSPSELGEDLLAPAFVCTANIDARDGGAALVAGNEKVLAARLSDAKFFWDLDRKTPLAVHAEKLQDIVFHEQLGTLADKAERVARLARWLVEEGIVKSSPERGGGPPRSGGGRAEAPISYRERPGPSVTVPGGTAPPSRSGEDLERAQLADLAQQAAELCKADLVTEMVGEFPELQGVMGGYYAAAEGLDPRVAAAIRDHYKPVGQGDEVPTAPVTVAVSLADKLDTLFSFFEQQMIPTGSKDPFALRRAGLGVIQLIEANGLRLSLVDAISQTWDRRFHAEFTIADARAKMRAALSGQPDDESDGLAFVLLWSVLQDVVDFFADRLKVQQREAGVRHDLIDAVFALGGEDDLVRLLARVKALQAFVETADGADLLAGYKRAANILKKEGDVPLPLAGGARGGAERSEASDDSDTGPPPAPPAGGRGEEKPLSYTPENAEKALIDSLGLAETRAASAIAAEDFAGAMAALASLREPIDRFFEEVTVNDRNEDKRAARLALLARFRAAVHQVADFSRIDG
ncbi:glycine--tRNA ligase subunit beta [Novosphingopyxis sp.]|uniref:glycine--tRNA ligase subunit beta n=1 Tax=Novosphingopyxis sp. TaxID=2709690 RepID=UPI003B598E7B